MINAWQWGRGTPLAFDKLPQITYLAGRRILAVEFLVKGVPSLHQTRPSPHRKHGVLQFMTAMTPVLQPTAEDVLFMRLDSVPHKLRYHRVRPRINPAGRPVSRQRGGRSVMDV